MKQQMEERKSMFVVFPPEATEERLLTSRRGDVNTWFVGTVNRSPREAHFSFIWSMQEFVSMLTETGPWMCVEKGPL